MPLITRCAHCHTVFRITAEQLQAHGGQVRCGRCMQVFNGLAALSPDEEVAVAPVTVPEPPNPEVTPGPAEPVSQEDLSGAATETLPLVPEPPQPIDQVEEQVAAGSEVSGEPADRDAIPAPEPPVEDNPFLQDEPLPPPEKPRRVLTVIASLLLGIVLAAQAVYFYRGEIAARLTLARPWLNEACARLDCRVELPQSPRLLLIEASDLQAVDPARPDRIQLTATLRNHASYAVGYPAIDLVLTNANDHTLARRVFLPHEYLGKGRDPESGIAANAELTVRLGLDTGNLGAAGFRLAVLAAPPR